MSGTWRRHLVRLVPATLFGRLALLLFVAVLASHVLALTLMFELRPPPPMPPPGWAPPPPPRHLLHPGLLLDIGVRLGALMVAAWIGARWLSQPIKRLAAAARALGTDLGRAPLPEDGTLECREASRVFNQMQEQIRRQLDERSQFVAAVSHDLRTPLTRMRLRVESIGDADQRRRFGQDIAEMDDMIRATLDYLRGASQGESMARLDVQALVEALADDLRALGRPVSAEGRSAPLMADTAALRRALGNLVENALRYGGNAEITLHDASDALLIEVADRGPGLPEEELEKVLQPFYRVESSRNRAHGGVGLGLAIVHDVARRHGGSLQLRNRTGGGLVAALRLPRATTARA